MNTHKNSLFQKILIATLIFAFVASPLSLSIKQARADGSGNDGASKCGDPDSGGCGGGSDCASCPSGGESSDSGDGTDQSGAPINFMLNSVIERVIDLQLPSPKIPWHHRRSYDSRMARETNTFVHKEGYRWFGSATNPYLRWTSGYTSLQLYADARVLRTFNYNSTFGVFTSPPDSPYTLARSGHATSEELYTLRNIETGEVLIFYGLDHLVTDENRGRLKELTNRTLQADGETGVTYSYLSASGSEMVDSALTAEGWLIDYEYYTTPANYLKSISVYAGPTVSDTLLAKAEYVYYENVTSPSMDIGSSGDLVQVKVSTRATDDTGSTLSIARTTQYRYYRTSGKLHQMKSIYEADSVQRVIDFSDGEVEDPEDLLSLDDGADVDAAGSGTKIIGDFSSRSFDHYTTSSIQPNSTTTSFGMETLKTKYGGGILRYLTDGDATWSGAVFSEKIGGDCSTCNGSVNTGVKREYYYLQLADWYGTGSGSDGAGHDEPNLAVRIVVEDTLDSTGTARYRKLTSVNYKGMWLRKAFLTDPLSSPSTSNTWCESRILDGNWRIEEHRMPSAHKGQITSDTDLKEFLDPYDPSATTGLEFDDDSNTVNTNSGLVYHYELDATGKRRTGKLVSEGAGGTKHYLWAIDYGDGDNDSEGVDNDEKQLVVARHAYPEKTTDRSATSRATTSYEYTFWDDTLAGGLQDTAVKTIKTIHPNILTTKNGSGIATETFQYLDEEAQLRWKKNGEGTVTYYAYHPENGKLAYTMVDVETDDLPSDITSGETGKWIAWLGSLPAEFASIDDDNLQLVAKYEFDDLGRGTKRIDPDNSQHAAKYFADGSVAFPYINGSGVPALPAIVTNTDSGGTLRKSYSVDPTTVSVSATTSLPTTTANYVSLTEYEYDSVGGNGKLTKRYHDIDGSNGEGVSKQYYGTRRYFDHLGRKAATAQYVKDGSFQVSLQILDDRGRVTANYQGVTATTPADYDALFASPGVPISSLAKVSEVTYDGGLVGEGHITKSRGYHTASKYTDTTYYFTFRGHTRGSKREYFNGSTNNVTPYVVRDIDWLGRTIAKSIYAAEPSSWPTDYANYVHDPTANSGKGGPTGSGFNNTLLTKYDNMGRVYRTLWFPGTQSVNHFEKNKYYDRNGLLVADEDPYGVSAEYAYDNVSRRYQVRIVKQLSGSKYSSGAFDYVAPEPSANYGVGNESGMSGGDEGVIKFVHSLFDVAGNAIEEHILEINHGDSDGMGLSADNDYVRASRYYWYDSANRLVTMANHGSGNGSGSGAGTWKYVGLPSSVSKPTASTDGELVFLYGYSTKTGRQELITDSLGIKTKAFYDDLSRKIYVAENHVNFAPPSTSLGAITSDEDRVTAWAYNGLGSVTELTAHNGTSEKQITDYFYSDGNDASLLTCTIFPDATTRTEETNFTTNADQERVEYNLDGSMNRRKDQRGVVIEYKYDNARRLTLNAATTIPSSVDDSVQAIGRSYDSLGHLDTITSYEGTTTGSTVANQIKRTYGSTGRIEKVQQNHSGVVAPTSPDVRFSYDDSVQSGVYDNNLRAQLTYYPIVGSGAAGVDGRLEYDYGSAGSLNDRLSRQKSHKLWDGNLRSGTMSHTVNMDYNGTERLRLLESASGSAGANTALDYFSGTSGDYDGWDRFGRVIKQQWKQGLTVVDQFDYAYDYAGNRTERNVAATSNDTRDQVYAYDDLNRLLSYDQGTLAGTITGSNIQRYWELEQLGNWEKLYDGLSTAGTQLEDRSHNKANECLVGAQQPHAYDKAGNLSYGDLGDDEYYYDAWNRLIRVQYENQSQQEIVRGSYEYDGLNRRIVRDETGDSGDLRHFYYNNQWQVLTEADGAGAATAIYSYNPEYVDSVAVRMTPDKGHFYTHDALFNVTSMVDESTDSVVERYAYSPYGEATVLNASFSPVAGNNSAFGNELLYTGRRIDPATGLQLNRNRFYHQQLGRWVSRDPIGYLGSPWNLYEYVSGHVLNDTDPIGLVNNAMLVHHYFFGDGEDVSINLNSFLNEAEGAKSMGLQIVQKGTHTPAACGNEPITTKFNAQFDLSTISGGNRLRVDDPNYSVGKFTVQTDNTCVTDLTCVACKCSGLIKAKSVTSCISKITYSDRFANPFDIGGENYEFGPKQLFKLGVCLLNCNRLSNKRTDGVPRSHSFNDFSPRGTCKRKCRAKYPFSEFGTPFNLTGSATRTYMRVLALDSCEGK